MRRTSIFISGATISATTNAPRRMQKLRPYPRKAQAVDSRYRRITARSSAARKVSKETFRLSRQTAADEFLAARRNDTEGVVAAN